MKIKLLIILVILLGLSLSGCTKSCYLEDISQITYTEESGTISPEYQLTEKIIITGDKVTLTRRGRIDETLVNEGTWEIEVDESEIAALFEQLEAVDCSTIKRVEPEERPIGGGIKYYSIIYAGDKAFNISYSGGTTYTNGMLIIEPINTFIEGLTFPAGATVQYKEPAD